MKWLNFKWNDIEKLTELQSILESNDIDCGEGIWKLDDTCYVLSYKPVGTEQHRLAEEIVEEFVVKNM